MVGSFTLVGKPDKKISLERTSHPCPKCKHQASVQLMRSERQFIIFNKCITSHMRVRYECSKCSWRNEELPHHQQEVLNDQEPSMLSDDRVLNQFQESNKTTSSVASAVY